MDNFEPHLASFMCNSTRQGLQGEQLQFSRVPSVSLALSVNLLLWTLDCIPSLLIFSKTVVETRLECVHPGGWGGICSLFKHDMPQFLVPHTFVTNWPGWVAPWIAAEHPCSLSMRASYPSKSKRLSLKTAKCLAMEPLKKFPEQDLRPAVNKQWETKTWSEEVQNAHLSSRTACTAGPLGRCIMGSWTCREGTVTAVNGGEQMTDDGSI